MRFSPHLLHSGLTPAWELPVLPRGRQEAEIPGRDSAAGTRQAAQDRAERPLVEQGRRAEPDRRRLLRNNKFFGRIGKDGKFEPYTASTPIKDDLTAILAKFAEDPQGVAAAHGKTTGRCCFCNTGLTDPKSTAVGYGPQCAKQWSLPWGRLGQRLDRDGGMKKVGKLSKHPFDPRHAVPKCGRVARDDGPGSRW